MAKIGVAIILFNNEISKLADSFNKHIKKNSNWQLKVGKIFFKFIR
jgi:hypothetical protein